MALKNVSNVVFSNTKKATWIDLWRQFWPPTCGCIYNLLVAFASDNEGRSLYISRILCIALSTLLDNNQNNDIKRLLLYSMKLYHKFPYKIGFKMQVFLKGEVHFTKLETELALKENLLHVNVMFSWKLWISFN